MIVGWTFSSPQSVVDPAGAFGQTSTCTTLTRTSVSSPASLRLRWARHGEHVASIAGYRRYSDLELRDTFQEFGELFDVVVFCEETYIVFTDASAARRAAASSASAPPSPRRSHTSRGSARVGRSEVRGGSTSYRRKRRLLSA